MNFQTGPPAGGGSFQPRVFFTVTLLLPVFEPNVQEPPAIHLRPQLGSFMGGEQPLIRPGGVKDRRDIRAGGRLDAESGGGRNGSKRQRERDPAS
jgi:hypothetical protein